MENLSPGPEKNRLVAEKLGFRIADKELYGPGADNKYWIYEIPEDEEYGIGTLIDIPNFSGDICAAMKWVWPVFFRTRHIVWNNISLGQIRKSTGKDVFYFKAATRPVIYGESLPDAICNAFLKME